MKRVVAVVVTFNRLELLKQCLQAVGKQTRPLDLIVVLNNASSDGTSEFLQTWRLSSPTSRRVLQLPTNTGGSGGFARAIREAYVENADWIWVMDDDSVPASDCLESLLANQHLENTGFLAPLVKWKDGTPCLPNATQADPMNWAERYTPQNPIIRITSATFVGLLLNRRALETVGLPVSQFFIWYDDIEFTLRISKRMSGYCVTGAHVTHMIPENAIPDYARVNKSNVWKHQFGIRNETAVRIATQRLGAVRALSLWSQRNREMKSGHVPLKLRLLVLMWGLKGLSFRYRNWIEQVSSTNSSTLSD